MTCADTKLGDRWEHGSTFELPHLSNDGSRVDGAMDATLAEAGFVGSGRVALSVLLAHGKRRHGWLRLQVPSYYCEDVVRTLVRTSPIPLVRYPCGPLDPSSCPDTRAGDVVLRVDYFGWGLLSLPTGMLAPVIDDLSHAPLQDRGVSGRYAFASLRKTLPLPDGGCIWVPHDEPLPELPPQCPAHDEVVRLRLAAMALKRSYLDGGAGTKAVFRALDQAAEEILRRGESAPLSGISRTMLHALDFASLQRARCENYRRLETLLRAHPMLEVLGTSPREPLALIVRTATGELRERLRAGLIARRIYPAVLWPIATPPEPWLRPEDVDFSRRTLALHIDGRYTAQDVERVAGAVHHILHSATPAAVAP